jgi:hypothetical protein
MSDFFFSKMEKHSLQWVETVGEEERSLASKLWSK